MKNKRIYFGVLHSWLIHERHIDHLRQLVRTVEQKAGVRWLNYDEIRSGLSAVIIPDGVGINPLAKGLTNMVQSPFVCPEAQVFIEGVLDTYRERAYPIIGIGDGAACLWELLGNPVGYFNSKLRCLPPTNETLVTYDTDGAFVDKFAYANVYGFNEINVSLSAVVAQIVSNIESESVKAGEIENSWDV